MTDNNALQNAIKLLRLECNDQIRQINTGAGLKTEGFTAINRLLKRCDAVFAAADAAQEAKPVTDDNTALAQELEAMIYKGVEALGLWAFANRAAILAALQSPLAPNCPACGDPACQWGGVPANCQMWGKEPPEPEQYAVERVARAIMAAPTRNATFATFIHEDEARSAARAALAAMPTKVEAPAADAVVAMQGAELRRIRKGMKLTLAELGEALGLSGNFIGMMERGEKAIEKRTALAVLYMACRER